MLLLLLLLFSILFACFSCIFDGVTSPTKGLKPLGAVGALPHVRLAGLYIAFMISKRLTCGMGARSARLGGLANRLETSVSHQFRRIFDRFRPISTAAKRPIRPLAPPPTALGHLELRRLHPHPLRKPLE